MNQCTNGSPITEHRKDGWPLCPCCGEDELYSLIGEMMIDNVLTLTGGVPWQDATMQHYIDAGLRCYKCNWSSQPDLFPKKGN